MPKFEEGDVIRLKSGGPHMTVEGHEKGGRARCVWFDENKQRHRDVFNEATLEKIEEDEVGGARIQ